MDGNDAARERILKVSTRLFAAVGFDAARVSQIAEDAGVNKALIYYYFKSKEAILDQIMDSLFSDLEQSSLEYIQKSIVRLIREERLDILPDRFRFIDQQALQEFLNGTRTYYCGLMEFVSEHADAFRILLLESLKEGKHKPDLFRLFNTLISTGDSPLFSMIHEADNDFSVSPERLLHKLFFTIMPIIQFVIYRTDINKRLSMNESSLNELFMQQLDSILSACVIGNDVLTYSI